MHKNHIWTILQTFFVMSVVIIYATWLHCTVCVCVHVYFNVELLWFWLLWTLEQDWLCFGHSLTWKWNCKTDEIIHSCTANICWGIQCTSLKMSVKISPHWCFHIGLKLVYFQWNKWWTLVSHLSRGWRQWRTCFTVLLLWLSRPSAPDLSGAMAWNQ